METKGYTEKKQRARIICAQLQPRYKASICVFDPTAVAVIGITDKQHSELCKKLSCSGCYSEILQSGFLLNFGEYK